mmetsp:Transcript_21202/g.47802  ORF Transcript_21202/g.47802 Transcript_21202/m.47802 type:complete len:367 (-) Transcript_21202:148-1248(-)
MDPSLAKQRSVASIPSKFETILHEGGKEKDAFWTRTHRFSYTDNELPGPGQYYKPKTNNLNPSQSVKGYTGMVSKSQRFARPRRATAPCPGSYDPVSGFLAVKSRKDFNFGASRAFCQPIVSPDYVKGRRANDTSGPGPGQYQVNVEITSPRYWGKKVPFSSGTQRFHELKKAYGSGEGAGEYDYESIARITGAFNELNKKVPSAAFRSRTGRKFDYMRASKDNPLDTLKPHPSLGPSLGIHVDIKPNQLKPEMMPGPGYYDPRAAEEFTSMQRMRHSATFVPSTLDRFGQPIVRTAKYNPTPGPGAYEVLKDRSQKVEATMSAFVSSTERDVDIKPRTVAPGPAYYNPNVTNKKSFHYNSNHRWV